jgi:hypothetical protein
MRADRLVSRAALLVTALAAGPACNPVLGPQPLDDNWRVFDGPRVSFYVRPGSVAEQNVARLSEVIEDQYTATVAALRLTYAGRVRGYAYDSASDANFESNLGGRAYPDTESFRFVCVAPVNANTFGLMQHEANHVFVVNGLGRAGTYFMTEGMATALVSETFHSNGRHFLFPWTKAHRAELPRVSRLVDDGEWGRVRSDIAYNTSASFLAWLLDTYGPDRLRAIVGATSSEFSGRIASVYGRSLDSLEEDWLRFCDSWVG